MDIKTLGDIVKRHNDWLDGDPAGRRADFSGLDLQGADLSGARLQDAVFWRANARGVDFTEANLRLGEFTYCNLSRADLTKANCWRAQFWKANLRLCRLRLCDLTGACLQGADLRSTSDLDPHIAASLQIVPSEGSFEGWKRCRGGVVARLLIPAAAQRSSSTGRLCRADRAEILEVVGDQYGVSHEVGRFQAGDQLVYPRWSSERWEPRGGITFYLTRLEAEAEPFLVKRGV